MKDIWSEASDELKSLNEGISYSTDDCMYYQIYASDGTILGIVNKTYENHKKVINFQFRETSGTIRQDNYAKVDATTLSKIIKKENMVYLLKNI